MTLTKNKNNNTYIFNCTFRQKKIPKDAGFWWNGSDKVWFTKDPQTAKKLAVYARDQELISELSEYMDNEVMIVYYDNARQVFYTKVSYANRDWPYSLGFVYNAENYRHETYDLAVIEKLINQDMVFQKKVDGRAISMFNKLNEVKQNKIAESVSITHTIEIPHTDGYELTPQQKAAVEYGAKRDFNFLIADPPGCLSGDTIVSVNRGSNGGITRKYSIEYVYKALHNLNKRKWDLGIDTYVRALKNGRIGLDKVDDVVYSGKKETYNLVLEDGKFIIATLDHKFLAEGNIWKPLSDFQIGDSIFINGKPLCTLCGSDKQVTISERAKFKGYCKKCIYTKLRDVYTFDEGSYIGTDGYRYLNGRKYKDFKKLIRGKEILEHVYVMYQHIRRLPNKNEDIHHINHDRLDNRIENLELLTKSEHMKKHKSENNFKNYIHRSGSEVITVPKLVKIKSIDYHGVIDTYDIIMNGDEHNFIANGIVTHNSGKTPMTIGCMNYLPQNVYFIACPVNAVQVWYAHLKNWFVNIDEYKLHIIRDEGKKKAVLPDYKGQKIIYITNWDQFPRFYDYLRKIPINCVIADEVHYVFNNKTKRGKCFFNLVKKIPQKIYLSGTPFDGYPEKFYHILHSLGFSDAQNWYTYTQRYCLNEKGIYDKKGASNMDEFQRKLREELMIRRPKNKVLEGIPPKIRNLFRIDLGEDLTLAFNEGKNFSLDTVKELIAKEEEDASFMAQWRKSLSIAKVPYTISYVEKLIEDGNKIVLFAHHKEAQGMLYEYFSKKYGCVRFKAGMSPKKRDESMIAFQNDPSIVLAVNSLIGASECITLTQADRIVQHETDYRGLKVSQAEDRGHRFGRKGILYIDYIVADNTLDVYVTQIMMKKLDITEKALDAENLEEYQSLINVSNDKDILSVVKEMIG